MKLKGSLSLLLLTTFVVLNSFAQDIPLVYDLENTGAECTAPPLPAFADLPVVEPLPDPFAWSDGSGRSTDFADWECRRAEIIAELEYYEVGPKPDRPEDITASYADGTLTVNITVNGNTLTLTSAISLPEGDGPFPAIIGMGGPNGSLPADVFTIRNIARIPFNYGQVMAHTQVRGSEPFNALYPELVENGAYSAWSWGVSRLIDGLELVAADLPIDLHHLAVTGCSFAGKMALWAGALDERIALTLVQESGGGGGAAWRVSETVGNVEKLGATSHVWFIQDMFQFSGVATARLPMDHHELMALVAPRAMLFIGNPSQEWLAEESGYVSCRAALEVWKTFGVADRFGFTFDPDHGHCAFPASQRPELEAFVDKFMLDSTQKNTNVRIHTFPNVDFGRWYEWWESGVPSFATRNYGPLFEAECTELGANWEADKVGFTNPTFFATPKADHEYLTEAPSSADDFLTVDFTLDKDTIYRIYARLNCGSNASDAVWAKVDNGEFKKYNGLLTNGWEWKILDNVPLTVGEHTLTIGICEPGAKIDKLCLSNYKYDLEGDGGAALNACVVGINEIQVESEYKLGQNYPNPVNGSTTISFVIPQNTYVSLKVYSVLGQEIAELAGKEYTSGRHTVDFDSGKLDKGVYFYTISADVFSSTRKMIIKEI